MAKYKKINLLKAVYSTLFLQPPAKAETAPQHKGNGELEVQSQHWERPFVTSQRAHAGCRLFSSDLLMHEEVNNTLLTRHLQTSLFKNITNQASSPCSALLVFIDMTLRSTDLQPNEGLLTETYQ